MEGETQATNIIHVEKEGADEAADTQLSREVIVGGLLWVKLHGSSWWPAQVVDENSVSGSNKPSKRLRGDVLVRLYGSYKYMYVDSNSCRLEFQNILMQNNGSYSEILKKSLEQDISRFKSGRSRRHGSKSKAGIVSIGFSQDGLSKEVLKQYSSKKESVGDGSSPRNVKNGNLLSEQPEKLRSKKRKQEGEQKKIEPNIPKLPRFSPRRLPAANMSQTTGKDGNSLPENSPKGKSKKQKLDGASKKVEPNTPNTVSLRCNSKTSVGRSEELSGRRTKVMQSLGLVAPSGSPFHRNGFMSPSSIVC